MEQTTVNHQLASIIKDWHIVTNESIDDPGSYEFIAHKVLAIRSKVHNLRESLKVVFDSDKKIKIANQKACNCLKEIENYMQIKIKLQPDKNHIEELMKEMKAIEPEIIKIKECITA